MVDISCQATDSLSGVSSSTCPEAMGAALDFGPGTHTLTAMATDRAGNTTTLITSFIVAVTYDSLCALTHEYASGDGVANGLCAKLQAAAAAAEQGRDTVVQNYLTAYRNQLEAQVGKAFTPAQAELLAELSRAL